MNKYILIFAILLFGTLYINAQSDGAKRTKGQRSSSNSIYLGFLGPTIPMSLNYEHIWTKNGVVNIGTKIGGFYMKLPKQNEFTLANGTFEFTFIFGRSKHIFDMGIGWSGHYGSYFSDKELKTKFYGVPTSNFSMGYRFQKPTGGVFFKIGFTSSSILLFATNDLEELAIGNAALYGFNRLEGHNPSFSLISIGIGFAFKK